MTTVADALHRLYRTYLLPPDAQPPSTFLDLSTDAVTGGVQLTPFTIPEDEELMRGGMIIEIGSELMLVTSYDEGTRVAAVQRGAFGTPAATHEEGDLVLLNPSYPRHSAFEFLGDNIITLYPTLYTVSSDNLVSIQSNISGIPDELAVEVIEVWPGDWTNDIELDARIVDFHPTVGGRAVITNLGHGSIWLRYRRRMKRPLLDTEELEDLGVDDAWVNILMAGVAADLFAGRDLPASHVEWVGGVLQAENIPVGTRAQLSVGLARYRELLIERAQKEMRAEYKAKVHLRQPAKMMTRSPFG